MFPYLNPMHCNIPFNARDKSIHTSPNIIMYMHTHIKICLQPCVREVVIGNGQGYRYVYYTCLEVVSSW